MMCMHVMMVWRWYLNIPAIYLVCVVGALPQVKKVMTASDLPLSTCSGARVMGRLRRCVRFDTHSPSFIGLVIEIGSLFPNICSELLFPWSSCRSSFGSGRLGDGRRSRRQGQLFSCPSCHPRKCAWIRRSSCRSRASRRRVTRGSSVSPPWWSASPTSANQCSCFA